MRIPLLYQLKIYGKAYFMKLTDHISSFFRGDELLGQSNPKEWPIIITSGRYISAQKGDMNYYQGILSESLLVQKLYKAYVLGRHLTKLFSA